MNQVDWLPGIVVLGAGVLGGLALAMGQRKEAADVTATRRTDLLERKAELMAALRSLQDVDADRGVQAASDERKQLELQAARVVRELDGLASGRSSKVVAQPPANPAGLSPQLRGAVLGGLVVGFVALLAFGLWRGSVERTGDMGITGRMPIGSEQVPGRDSVGGPVEGVPPSLRPKPSGAVDQARAAVAANPDNVSAWAALGYALIDAQGWIDAFETSRRILEMQPGHPDGLVQAAAVRVAMGQLDAAGELVAEALRSDPKHLPALSYQGMIAWRAGDAAAARAAWQRGLEAGGADQGFEELLAMADRTPPPSGAPTGHPPGGMGSAGPAAGASTTPASPAGAAPGGAAGQDISGTLVLADGATPPAGATLFISVRPEGVTRGPPAAALRLQPTGWPVEFTIGPANAMMAGTPFPARAQLTARLDADGNAMTRDAGDLGASEVFGAGSTGVTLTLAP